MHLKRKTMPKSWPLARKSKKKYIVPGKGAMPLNISLPLLVALRDVLNVLSTKTEAKKVLRQGDIIVDNKVVKDEKFRVGLFDRLYIKKSDKLFTLEIKGKNLDFVELKKEEMCRKPAKVIGKRNLKGEKFQINLYDGKNMIINSNDAKRIAVGDTIIVDLKENRIEKHIKFEKGASVFVIGGKHQGERGKIVSIDDIVIVKNEKEFGVAKQNIFVIEK